MQRLNPFDKIRRANEQKAQEERHKARLASIKKDRKATKKAKAARRKVFNGIWAGMQESFEKAEEAFQKIGTVEESEEEEEDDQ